MRTKADLRLRFLTCQKIYAEKQSGARDWRFIRYWSRHCFGHGARGGQGGETWAVPCKVGLAPDCQQLVQRTIQHFGHLDVACNYAGIIGPSALTADYPLDGWDQVMQTNLSGVFYGMQA